VARAASTRPAALRGRLAVLGAIVVALGAALDAAPASAAEAPRVTAAWASEVTETTVRLNGEIDLDPAQATDYYFRYLPDARYRENVLQGREPFAGASRKPSTPFAIDAGEATAAVSQRITGLVPQTAYRYQLYAYNGTGAAAGAARLFATEGPGGALALPDGRGWEMVSPVQKGGGQVDGPGEDAGGGDLQAAADGSSVTYNSSVSFGGGEGAPPASQYVARRGTGSWVTQNITTPTVSGAYDTRTGGVPYQIFSGDLSRALLSNGRRCREGGEGCAVANPPLPGSGAPAGYRNYYLRDNASNAFGALLGSAALAWTPEPPSSFEVSLAGVTPDLAHVVLSSCAALTAQAAEVPAAAGCDEAERNLYEWSGGDLQAVNVLPGHFQTTPGATLAAPSGAISEDGRRVYFSESEDGAIYLYEAGAPTRLLPGTAGASATFEAASADGSVAFFLAASDLYRYLLATGTSQPIATGVTGVLGTSEAGAVVYYQDAGGLRRWAAGTTTTVAAGAEAAAPSDYPPATGTARVSADGGALVFLSRESDALSGYDDTALGTGERVDEVYLFSAGSLLCLSCNPTGERPLGGSTIPGAVANGTAIDAYRPRALSGSGDRVFFDTLDGLVPQDSNGAADVYEWEAFGVGTCGAAPGCLALVSSGKSAGGAFFADASGGGADVFFRTDASLVPGDPGSYDLYDARVGGGFAIPQPPIECEGDACQSLPSEPVDPAINTTNTGAGNPPVRFYDTTRHKPRYHRLRHHRHPGHRAGGKHRRHHKRKGRR
jgi:hypothetical protein